MNLDDFPEARARYRYVPAHLVAADDTTAELNWENIRLRSEIPLQGDWNNDKYRSKVSSFYLDGYHNILLNAESKSALLHGLASAVFWGNASGSDHRIHKEKALARARWLPNGKGKSGSRSPAQPPDEIVAFMRSGRKRLQEYDLVGALNEIMKIKFLGMSFASKILTFMNPNRAAIYDAVISMRLLKGEFSELREMGISTAAGGNRNLQAQTYAKWCAFCTQTAKELNLAGKDWVDWDGTRHQWRTVDVERAFFALGRH